MAEYYFYKSFLNNWIAVGAQSLGEDVWYSSNGHDFYPLKSTVSSGKLFLEDNYGPEHWRGIVNVSELSGEFFVLELARGENKPIFRIQSELTGPLKFDPNPKFRIFYNLWRLVDGQVLCLTCFSPQHYSNETVCVYLGQLGKGFEKLKVLKFVEGKEIVTNRGTLNLSSTTWEGYSMLHLDFEDYSFGEDDDGLTLWKK